MNGGKRNIIMLALAHYFKSVKSPALLISRSFIVLLMAQQKTKKVIFDKCINMYERVTKA